MTITRQCAPVLAAFSVVVGLAVSTCSTRAAASPPPGFPDLAGFAAVPVEDYFVTYLRGRRVVVFSTPHHLVCDFDAPADLADPPTPRLHCAGDLPGTGAACTAGTVEFSPSDAYEFLPYNWKCGDVDFRVDDFPYWSGKPLVSGEKLSYGNVTCAVGDDDLIACLDTSGGQHGFVVRASGSRAF